jgi:hypothetical protein
MRYHFIRLIWLIRKNDTFSPAVCIQLDTYRETIKILNFRKYFEIEKGMIKSSHDICDIWQIGDMDKNNLVQV